MKGICWLKHSHYSQPLIPPWLQFVRVWPYLRLSTRRASNQQSNNITRTRTRARFHDAQTGRRRKFNLRYHSLWHADRSLDRRLASSFPIFPRFPPLSPFQFLSLVINSLLLFKLWRELHPRKAQGEQYPEEREKESLCREKNTRGNERLEWKARPPRE